MIRCNRNGAGSVKEVEKRRNHNDNDPGHVFLRWDILSFVGKYLNPPTILNSY